MASFKDNTGRDWRVSITFGHCEALKAVGFDLGQVGTDAFAAALYGDPFRLLDALCVLTGAGRDDLGAALDADAMNRAVVAVEETSSGAASSSTAAYVKPGFCATWISSLFRAVSRS